MVRGTDSSPVTVTVRVVEVGVRMILLVAFGFGVGIRVPLGYQDSVAGYGTLGPSYSCATCHNIMNTPAIAPGTEPCTLCLMSTPDPTASKSLRDVRREQAAERRNLRNQRSLARERRESLDRTRNQQGFVLKQDAVVTGLVPRISGAIDSWAGKRVPLSVEHPNS